ncbi:hypothetical protein [Bacillus sp. 165]|uniref:hypothetical protein n=1 Tax=Bacillus sp. 165 TaxID=1529117 RepID=UPI001ADD2119|nr:hypothetical protein [Bacillus sp. 165]MBO9128924.1 hypothetical protein [Bacillus sp. 165]
MAGYQQIQTYITNMDSNRFDRVLQTCKQILQKTTLLGADIEKWIGDITWSTDDEGLFLINSPVCSPTFDLGEESGKIKAALSMFQWKKVNCRNVPECWIELSFCLKSELTDEELCRMYSAEIEAVMLQLSQTFQETGVYLTNVLQDGEPFEGLIMNNNDKLWDFQSAFIPNALISQYQHIPVHFDTCVFSHGISIKKKPIVL